MDPRGILKAFPKRKKIHADSSSKALAKIPKKEDGEGARGEQTQFQNPRVLGPLDFPHCSRPESDIRTDAARPGPAGWLIPALYQTWPQGFDRPLAVFSSAPP